MNSVTINANGFEINIIGKKQLGDYISLTDIAKYKTVENPGYIIQNWMRTRNTVRFLGLWEQFHNPNFNCLEFEAIENEAGYMIKMGLSRAERAIKLNKMAIEQLTTLANADLQKRLE